LVKRTTHLTFDSKHQVVVHAEAFGEPQEHDLLKPMIEGTRKNFQAIGKNKNIFKKTQLTADAGFHTENNMKMLFEEKIDGYVADILFRKRDLRFKTAARHKPKKDKASGHFKPKDFIYDQSSQTCLCPAGNKLYRNGRNIQIRGFGFVKFRGLRSTVWAVPCGRSVCVTPSVRSRAKWCFSRVGQPIRLKLTRRR
jgi:hypothetical protein